MSCISCFSVRPFSSHPGKSTLLDLLTGRKAIGRCSGELMFNGKSIANQKVSRVDTGRGRSEQRKWAWKKNKESIFRCPMEARLSREAFETLLRLVEPCRPDSIKPCRTSTTRSIHRGPVRCRTLSQRPRAHTSPSPATCGSFISPS